MTAFRPRSVAPVLCALLAACATTGPPALQLPRFADWDADASGFVERTEFFHRFAGAGLDAGWDADRDGEVDPTEFAAAAFWAWDEDADGALDAVEWRTSALRWDADGVDFGPFDRWDADRDGVLGRAEFDTRLAQSGLYAAWDRDLDRTITLAELGENVYRLWDRDGSGYLDGTEWSDAERLAFTGARTGLRPAGARSASRSGVSS